MKHLKYIFLILSVAALSKVQGQNCNACDNCQENDQLTWIEPQPADVTLDSITLYVNLALDSYYEGHLATVANETNPVYMWTWGPGTPNIGNGTWDNSNDEMVMIQSEENPNIWYKKFWGPDLYDADASEFYDCGINFLCKLKNGNGGAAPEDKTDNMNAAVIPPPSCEARYCVFPSKFRQDDIITLTYNLEEEPDVVMSDFSLSNGYLYVIGIDDNTGLDYSLGPLNQSDMFTEQQVQPVEGRPLKFQVTIILEEFLELPEGVEITTLLFKAFKSGGDTNQNILGNSGIFTIQPLECE